MKLINFKTSIIFCTFLLIVRSNALTDNKLTNNHELSVQDEKMHDNLDHSVYLNSIEFNLRSSAERLKSRFNTLIDQNIKEFLYNIEQIKSEIEKTSIFHQSIVKCHNDLTSLKINLTQAQMQLEIFKISESIRNGEFSVGLKRVSELGNIYLKSLIDAVYENNVNYTMKIIQFLNLLSNNDKIIFGYRILYERMIKYNHVYSTTTTSIAYRVFNDFNQINNNENLLFLRKNLPESLKNFPWNRNILISNEKYNTTIRNGGGLYDNFRHIGYTHSSTNTMDLYNWFNFVPVSNGEYFYIEGKAMTNFKNLYADEKFLDIQRRHVFRSYTEIKGMSNWQLEPLKESPYFKIKNIHWNEYLMIEEKIILKSSIYKLFTLRNSKCENDGCKWHIYEPNNLIQ